ncbi:MAG: tetratricopeptide repeat protein [Bacteroidetes bacterium]|nr:tetratricopeptide repeat protein [Bacteroidota bacterium]
MGIRTISILLLCLSAESYCIAQSDATTQAQQLVVQHKFRAAERILRPEASGSSDVSLLWYYGQVAHWAGHDRGAAKSFDLALDQDPDNTKLRLDYARMLYEAERLNAALRQLDKVMTKDTNDAEAHLIRSNIYRWYARYQPARRDTRDVLDRYPDNATAQDLSLALDEATAPYLRYTVGYQRDDQPMQVIGISVESGLSYSWLLNPKVQATDREFYAAGKWNVTLAASLGNKFVFGKAGTDVSLSLGVFKSFSAGTDWTGDVTVRQKLYKYLSLQLQAGRAPYLSTLSSASLSLMQNTLGASLILNKENSWSAQAAYSYQFFNDHNPIQTASVWALSQPVKASVFSFRFGYGYRYTTSARSTYRSVKSLSEILATYTAGEQIAGIYDPYFTPLRQHIHSAIIAIGIRPARFVSIGIKGDIGFYAQAQNPYLYLDKTSADVIYLASGSYKEVFHPYRLSANIDFKLSRRISLGADYAYTSAFFYASHYTSIHLLVTFLKHAR